MKFEESFAQHLKAGAAGMWVQTREPPETQRVMRRVCTAHDVQLLSWDADVGLREVNDDGPTVEGSKMAPGNAIKSVFQKIGEAAESQKKYAIALHNLHDFIKIPDLKQSLLNAIAVGKSVGAYFIILSPFVNIPDELQTYIAVLRHEPPGHEEIQKLVNRTLGREEGSPLQKATLEALSGLMRFEAEQELALCLARDEPVTPKALWHSKAKVLEKGGFLKMERSSLTFADVKGLAHLKDFTLRAFRPERKKPAKGICLVGASGAGKSLFSSALGNEVGRNTVLLRIGSLLGSLVGQSEANLRLVLDQLEALAPVVVRLEEIEKDLAGSSSSNDSGVMARIFGTLLTWRQETTADVYLIATANNVASIPYEFLRPGRFDATFFLDLPTKEERDSILEYHLKKAGLVDSVAAVNKACGDLEGWTGAEVEQLCYLVSEMGYSFGEAVERVPVNVRRAPEAIRQIKEFASGWALSASSPGIYYNKPLPSSSIQRRLDALKTEKGTEL